jgi:hypothetical protein
MEWVVLVIVLGFIISRLESIKIQFKSHPEKNLVAKTSESSRKLGD